jgi:hypothetical protein
MTTTTARLAAAAAAVLVTFVTVESIANYALPQAPAVQLASAQR